MYNLDRMLPDGSGALTPEARAQLTVMGHVKARAERWKFLTEGLKPGHPLTNAMEACFDRIIEVGMGVPASYLGNDLRKVLTEESSSSVMGSALTFTTVSLGLIRQVFPELIANQLMSTQPMPAPTAQVFSLDVFRTVTTEADENVTTPNKAYATNTTEGAAIKEISIKLSQATVTATEKKLKALWPLEAEQNLMAYHGLTLDDETASAMADEIAREINLGAYDELLTATGFSDGIVVAGNTTFNAQGYLAGDTTSESRKAYDETLWNVLIDTDNLVYKKRFRRTNVILTGPNGGARLEKLRGWTSAFDMNTGGSNATTAASGAKFLYGNLQKRWDVYVDPAFPETTIFGAGKEGYYLLLKSDRILQAGTIFAPYIMNWVSQPFTDPNTLKTVRATMSRYAFKKLSGGYGATCTLTP